MRFFYLFAGVVFVWGFNWPIMKLGLEDLTPLWFAAFRMGIGVLCLAPFVLIQGHSVRPSRRDMPIIAGVGILQMGVGMGLVYLGLDVVEAGRSAVLSYTMPLWIAPIAWLWIDERLGAYRFFGVLFGLVGLGLLFNPLAFDWQDAEARLGNGLLLLAALCWAVAMTHVRAHDWHGPPLVTVFWQFVLAFLLLTAWAWGAEGAPRWPEDTKTLLILAYNGTLGTAFCFWAFIEVNRHLPAMTMGLGSLAIPVVGVGMSALWLGEALTASLVGGLCAILIGVALTALAHWPRKA